ncbi:MAG: MFS transporter [Erysipelotrichaceae bacterium]|nr:MFS transporter [Erysipelotrichaceae bacterium]
MNKLKGSFISYFLMYLCFYMAFSFLSGLLSVYLMNKGYTATQVSFVVSMGLVASVVFQPIVGYFSDHFNERLINMIVLFISALFGTLFVFMNNIYMITLCYSMALGLFNSAKPVIERFATLSAHPYGKIRIWGSIGYAIGFKVSGYIYNYIKPEYMFILYSLGLIVSIVGMLLTKDVKTQSNMKQSDNKQGIWHKDFIIYLLVIAIFYGCTNINTTYLPSFLEFKGISVDTISTVIFFTTLMELPVIFFSDKLMIHFDNQQLLFIEFILLVIQFTTYAFIPIHIIQIIVTIATKAATTMLFIILNMKIVATIIDASHQITALSIVSMVNSVSSIIFQNIGGYIIDSFSYQFLYMILLMSVIIGILVISRCSFLKKGRITYGREISA